MLEPEPLRCAYQGKTGMLVKLDKLYTGKDKNKGRDAADELRTNMLDNIVRLSCQYHQ